jgi:hypothetical protein
VGLISMVGLVGAWWAGRQLAGMVGGLAVLFLLSVAPSYLDASRQALAEIPSIAPCLLALACAVRWYRGGRAAWLYSAALLATVGVLVKPMVIAVAAPLGLFMLLRRRGLRPHHVLISLGLVLGLTGLLVLLFGPAEIYQQMVHYRLSARGGGGYELRRNVRDVLTEPFREQPGLFLLAAVGGLLLLRTTWRSGLALVSWPILSIGMLLTYYPLHPKHLTYIYPPLVMLAGAGLGRAAQLAWRDGPSGRPGRMLTIALAAGLAALPLGAVPSAFSDGGGQDEPEDADLHVFDAPAAASLQLLSGSNEFVLTDHPYVALQARRMVPPPLVDISFGRIRADVLTDKDTIREAERFDTRVVLTWADRLRRMPGVPPWIDRNFQLSHAFGTRSVKIPRGAKDRSIYLRRDVNMEAARARMEEALEVRETADFEGQLRLLGASLSSWSLEPREPITLTLGWQALALMSSDYHVTVELIGEDGRSHHDQEHDLDGGARGTSTWAPGRWLFRTFVIQPEEGAPSGEYQVRVAILDPKSGRALRPTLGAGASTFDVERQRAVTVATISIP